MNQSEIIAQLNSILDEHDHLSLIAKRASRSLDDNQKQMLSSRAVAAIRRISGHTSTYGLEIDRILAKYSHPYHNFDMVMGVLEAMRDDVKQGYLQNLISQVRAEIFSDFLEMGEHLLNENYKDAAAVIIGSVLEDSLRKLADSHGITTINDRGKSLTIEPLNTELAKNKIYNKLVQKQITSWADLRNNAAHGRYSEYQKEEVKLMLLFVQQFCGEYLN